MTPRPLVEADLSRVTHVFTDVDGTLTLEGKIHSTTLRAMELLREAGVPVIMVTGRPAGWAEAWARTLPVAAVICENGGLAFVWRGERLHKLYAQPLKTRLRNRPVLTRHVNAALKAFPMARISIDSAYTEVDLAIDHNEDVKLPPGTADRLEAFLHARGVNAVRSNVHVNCWIGRFDKRVMVERYLKSEVGTRLQPEDPRYLYVGDSYNDAPLFGAFSLSVGVANVRAVLASIPHAPRYITRREGGRGFEEIARRLLASRKT